MIAQRRASTTALNDPRVRSAVVALLYNNASVGVLMNLLSVPVVWLVYHDLVPTLRLNVVLALWAGVQFLSAWNRRDWQRLSALEKTDENTSTTFLWRARSMAYVLSVSMAALLGVIHFAVAPATPALAAALALVYVLGASISTLIYMPQIRIFTTVILGSQAALLAHGSNPAEWLLALLFVGLIVGLWTYGHRYSARLQQVIVLRYEVQDLLAEQERVRNAAEVANQAKSRFFAAASHDVRQPLQAVMLTFHALRHARTDERRMQLLDNAERNLTALRQLFDQVLDISRIEAGALPVKPQYVPLQPLFDKLDARLSEEAAARHVWLRFVATGQAVYSDPDALERMLVNLVSNAIKHTERGGVWVALRPARGRLEVRDSGVGIAPEHQQKIFEEFYQVDNAGRDRASGLGLGLSIVRRLGDLLHHPLGLASTPGRGSTFWISLAAHNAPPVAVMDAVPATHLLPENALSQRAIYLIENDEQVARALTELLRDAGAVVHCFATAEAAINAAKPQQAVDAVISDYRLGGTLDGVEVVMRLRAVWQREVGAIILTGDTAIKDLKHIETRLHTKDATQRTRLLHKPVPAVLLIEAVLDLCEAQANPTA